MKQAQIQTYGVDGILAERLRELAQSKRIWLRETNQFAACRSLLQSAAPAMFIMVLGRDLERELALLEEVHACLPDVATIVIGEADNLARPDMDLVDVRALG